MKKFLFIITLLINIVFGATNECKSDLYFANGIDTDERYAKKFKSFNPTFYKQVANWKVNYNHTHSIAIDLYESFLQKTYEDKPGTSLAPFIWNLDEIADYFS